ncbi:hypothetical protein BJV78DRAFT_1158860 [Lactifluus subvellereus]|nr:hypothetical protein BJV78DRAFT_1158860 [Lactifluus subvellereus]
MHAPYVSLFVLAAFAAVPALSTPLSARNIVGREAADIVARNAPSSTLDKVTTPNRAFDASDMELLRLLNGRSVDDSTSLSGRDQMADSPGHNNLPELLMLSTLSSRDFTHGRELHARSFLTFLASNALHRLVIPVMGALSRVFHRDIDNKSCIARSVNMGFRALCQPSIGLREVPLVRLPRVYMRFNRILT